MKDFWENFPNFSLAKPIEFLSTSAVIRNDIHADFLNHTQLLLRPTKATGPVSKPQILRRPKKDRAVAPIGAAWRVFFWRRFAVPETGARSSRALCYPVAAIESHGTTNLPMKPLVSFLLTLSFPALLHADEPAPPATVGTFIPTDLKVRPFIPPAPPVEKTVPAMRVDSAVTVPAAHSRTLTILRGEASTLPDIPKPVLAEPLPARELTPEELARQAEERRHQLNFNAEVYENGVSILRWQHPDTAESYEAICGFDVNLLAGLGQFTSDGEIYQLSFIPPGVRPATRSRFSKLPLPKPPEAAPDTITITRGNANDPVGTATVTLLRDLIATEKSRLIVYQEERTIHQQAVAAWAKSHPILPRNETIWFRPHRGSRYLTNPTPEKGIAQ